MTARRGAAVLAAGSAVSGILAYVVFAVSTRALGAEGSVGYRLVIGTAGRVSSCELTRPSGQRALDDATCRLIAGRARFEPATDETGAKVLGTFIVSVRWEIPE